MNPALKARWKAVQHFLKITPDGDPGIRTVTAVEQAIGFTPALPPVASLPDLLASILEAEVGTREVPMNSNRGPRVEQYQRATGLGGTGWPWCAALICWGIREAGDQIPLPFARPTTAGAWDFERWAREQRLPIKKPYALSDLRRGDILVYTFSHIGVCTHPDPLETVEGNTDAAGSREGGGVYIKTTRTLSQIRSRIRLVP